MANQKEFVYKVKIVNESGQIVEQTAASFKELNKSVQSLQSELDNADFGSDKWNTLNKELSNSKQALGEATKKSEEFSKSQQSLGDRLSSIPGPVGQVAQSVQGLGTAFKALIANPIGAVLAALALVFVGLYKALQRNEEAMDKLSFAFAKIGGLLEPLIGLAGKLAEVLVDGLVAGVDGLVSLIGKIPGLGDAFEEAAGQAESIAKALDDVEDAERDLSVLRAQQNKDLAKARELLSDANAPYKDRKKALDEIKKSEEKLAKLELDNARKRETALRQQIKLEGASTELRNQLAQATIAVANAEESLAGKQRLFNKQEKALVKEVEAERKAAFEERKKQQEELKKKAEERVKFEKDLDLQSITDETERAKAEVEIQKQAQLEQLNQLGFTEEKKAELREQITQNSLNKIAKIEEDARKKKEAEDKAAADKLYAQQKQSADIQLELAQSVLNEEINRLNNYISEKQAIAGENREDELDKAEDAYQAEKLLGESFYETQLGLIESAGQQVLEKLAAQKAVELSNTQLTADQKLQIEKKYGDAVVVVDQNTNAAKQKVRDLEKQQIQAQRDLLAGGLAALGALAGDNFELQQAVAYASTIVGTYDAAQKAYASQLSIPTPDAPVRASIAAGIAIAQGLARAIQISKQKKPEVAAADGMVVGQGGGRLDNIPVRVSNGESIINARSTSMFKPLLSAINQVGGGRKFASGGITGVSTQVSPETSLLNSIALQSQNTAIKTYVVSTDISSQVALDRVTKSRSVL